MEVLERNVDTTLDEILSKESILHYDVLHVKQLLSNFLSQILLGKYFQVFNTSLEL